MTDHVIVSKLWSRTHSDRERQEITEFPLFMAQSGITENTLSPRTHQSHRSMMNTTIPILGRFRPSTVPASSVYSQSIRQSYQPEVKEDASVNSFYIEKDLEANDVDTSEISTEKPSSHKRRHRRVSRQTIRKIQSKARISFAFGITLLAALITYLAMAVTGTGSGIMFHILSIILILCLAGVFCHSSITLLILLRRKNIKLKNQQRWWHGTPSKTDISSSTDCNNINTSILSNPSSQILNRQVFISASNEEAAQEAQQLFGVKWIAPPPPVYGQHRESIRLNPELVHVEIEQLLPSTPTYDEAMSNVQQAIDYEPPSYRSNGDRSGNLNRESNVHPLERQRMYELLGNPIPMQTTTTV